MTETWVVILVYPKNLQSRMNVLLDFIKPTVQELENKNLLMTFHFFFEPEIHFRVRPKEDGQASQIETIIKNNLTKVQKFIKKADFSKYTGEEKAFGIEGWQLAQKYFECCCRISLLYLEVATSRKTPPSPQYIGDQFNVGKLVHCFLNQMGFGAKGEADFHSDRGVERRLMSLGVFQRLNGIESRLSRVERVQQKSSTATSIPKKPKQEKMKVDKAVKYV